LAPLALPNTIDPAPLEELNSVEPKTAEAGLLEELKTPEPNPAAPGNDAD
jgi:hypothetical protein